MIAADANNPDMPKQGDHGKGLALAGALGVGKSYLQRELVTKHGFWTPRTITTRKVDKGEPQLQQVSPEQFKESVRAKRSVIPIAFAGTWYAWLCEDFKYFRATEGRMAILNVRPYTALLLSAMVEQMVPVWLWLPPEHLEERRASRGADRDHGRLGQARETQDQAELDFQGFFPNRVVAGIDAVSELLRISAQ